MLDYFVDFKKNRFEILKLIDSSNGICPSKIMKTLNLSISTANSVADNLYLAGLINRKKETNKVWYSITPRGKKLLNKLNKIHKCIGGGESNLNGR